MSPRVPHCATLAPLALSLAVAAAPAHGQIRGSERATVSQVSDGTKVTVD